MRTITINLPAKRLFLLIAVLVLVTLLSALVAMRLNAHGGQNSEIVHLCVHNNSGVVEVVDASGSCRRNWSPVDVKGVPAFPEAPGAAIDAMVHPISDRITGGGVRTSDGADVIDRLDEADISKAVMQAVGFFGALVMTDEHVQHENDFVAGEVAEFPDRLIGFCGINPLLPDALDEIDRCLALEGMVGIKLNTPFSGMDLTIPDHEARLRAVLEKARDHDAPVQLHVQSPRDAHLEHMAFENLAAIIAAHPQVRVSHSHCGGVIDEHTSDRWLELLGPRLNASLADSAFLDTSICLNNFEDAPFSERELIVWRLRQWGVDRLLFSSDYVKINPRQQTPLAALATLEKYPFTQEEIDLILSGQAASAWLCGPSKVIPNFCP